VRILPILYFLQGFSVELGFAVQIGFDCKARSNAGGVKPQSCSGRIYSLDRMEEIDVQR